MDSWDELHMIEYLLCIQNENAIDLQENYRFTSSICEIQNTIRIILYISKWCEL